MLSGNLTEDQKKSLTQILTTAEQKRNQKRSDAIEKSGGKLRKQFDSLKAFMIKSRLNFLKILTNKFFFFLKFRIPIHSTSNSNELQLQQPTIELNLRHRQQSANICRSHCGRQGLKAKITEKTRKIQHCINHQPPNHIDTRIIDLI